MFPRTHTDFESLAGSLDEFVVQAAAIQLVHVAERSLSDHGSGEEGPTSPENTPTSDRARP